MTTQQARTRTPYDITLSAGGLTRDFMLAEDPSDHSLMYKSGLLQEIIDATRNDSFSYNHRDPRVDVTAGFEDFSLGAGFEDAAEEDGSDFAYRIPVSGFRGYNYTQGVDLSRGTRGYLSNELQRAGLALDGAARKIVLTSLGLFAITQRYINRWSGTSWVQVFDDGAMGSIYDLFEFTNATATYCVAATRSAAYHYTTDGISWVASEAPPSAATFRASSSTSTSGATSLSVGEPSAAATGDILILTVYAVTDTVTITPTVGSDWTLLATLGANGTGTGRVYWCRRGGSAPNYQMLFGTSVAAAAVCSAYSGCKVSGVPIEALSAITNTGNSVTYTYTGADQTLVVPATVTSMTFTLKGAGSGSAAGGLVIGTLAVTPGDTIHIQVGGIPTGVSGGYNGGGDGAPGIYASGSGGGGATDIRYGGSDLAHRVAVAAGAGGGAHIAAGGAGGAATGASGTTGAATGPGTSGGTGGTGGTSSAGGTTGGTLGVGGTGLVGDGDGGGGGGGGYYGGGGGGSGVGAIDGDDNFNIGGGGGGGGGSNYAGGLTSTTSTQGGGAAVNGAGSVSILWSSATTTPTVAPVTTLGANRLVIGVLGSKSNTGGTTAPGGTTEVVDVNGANGSAEIYDIAAANASVYGAYTATFANSVGYSSVGFALLGVDTTGASNITRFAARGQASGAPVLWAIDAHGSIRNATLVTTPSNWSAIDSLQLGDRDATQLGLNVIDNVFYLVHKGGITSYDGSVVSTVFTSPFADPPALTARPVMALDNHLFLTFGNALLHFDSSTSSLEKIWPRGPQDGNAELNGIITAMTVNEKYVWFALKNSAGNTYLMQLDHGHTVTVGSETVYPAHSIAYVGANDITAMSYLKASAASLSLTNPTIAITSAAYVGFYILPKPGLRPEDDSSCRFDITGDRVAVGSFVNFRSQAFPKWLTRGDIEADTTATETVELFYEQPDGTSALLVAANTDQNGRTTAVLSPPISFTRVRYRVLLNTGDHITSPMVRGVDIHAAPNPPRDRGFIFTVNLSDGQGTKEHGVRSRWKASELDTFLFGMINELVTIRDLYGVSYLTKTLDIAPLVTRYNSDGSVEELLTITLGQLTS